MILTVNIGNTHITVGGYEQDTLIFCGRLHSDPAATVEEYAIRLVNLLQLYGASPAQIEGGILGSVVPMLSGRVLAAFEAGWIADDFPSDGHAERLAAAIRGLSVPS